jgi:hypothetical protein
MAATVGAVVTVNKPEAEVEEHPPVLVIITE